MATVVPLALVRQRVGPLEDKLVAELTERATRTVKRPAHRPPSRPGAFGDGFLADLDALDAQVRALGPLGPASEGDDLLAAPLDLELLPDPWSAALERAPVELDALLAHTLRVEGDLSEARARLLSVEGTWRMLRGVGRLARFHIARDSRAGRSAKAVDRCLDVLALGRDAALLGGCPGFVEGIRLQKVVAPACGEALDDAPAADKLRALTAIVRVRDSMPAARTIVHDGYLELELLAFSDLLDEAHRAQLPEAAKGWPQAGPVGLSRLLARDGWASTREAFDRAIGLAELDREAREAGLAQLRKELLRNNVNPLAAVALADSMARQSDALDGALALLDGLALAAAADLHHAQQGSWPRSVEVLLHDGLTGRVTVREFHGEPSLELDDEALMVAVTTQERKLDAFEPFRVAFGVSPDEAAPPPKRHKAKR